ncbi:MAG: hypothetical protein ACW97A_09735 [Candidatus Thorarchaeota archaeon]|jgi:WD40 repeat protein
MSNKSDATADSNLGHEMIVMLEADVVGMHQDEKFVYAACRDQKVRVWAKDNWQLETVLGDTDSLPLAVQADNEHLFVTCERRVYVWRKDTWGMIGWFELSYSAITSSLRGDYLDVGAKDGRSIEKDTHETSSWQVYKSDISYIWSDPEIICIGTKKEEPRVFQLRVDAAPTELARLEEADKGSRFVGNQDFLITGLNTGEVKVWDRLDWTAIKTLSTNTQNPITSMWASNSYLVTAANGGLIVIWDLIAGSIIGEIRLNNGKIDIVEADKSELYLATSEGLVVISLKLEGQSLDLHSTDNERFGSSLLRSSPYDVLEGVVDFRRRGDVHLKQGLFDDAVTNYELALQMLVDNMHALLEVPEERENLTNDLNERLGGALLRSKISEIKLLNKRIEDLSDELDLRGRTNLSDDEVKQLWHLSTKAVRESHVLAEAQTENMISYQLTYVTDSLESDLNAAKEKVEKYQEKVNQARALTEGKDREWRWMERSRSNLADRLAFLTITMQELKSQLSEVEADSEVQGIISKSLNDFKKIHTQISKILSASDEEQGEKLASREEAIAAIEGLLRVMPKKRAAMSDIADISEKQKERERMKMALNEALETATRFKMKDEIRDIQNELASITNLHKDDTDNKS